MPQCNQGAFLSLSDEHAIRELKLKKGLIYHHHHYERNMKVIIIIIIQTRVRGHSSSRGHSFSSRGTAF